MKVLICTVQGSYSAKGENSRRIQALGRLLKASKQLKADLVVLPGGYLYSSSTNPELAAAFARLKTVVEEAGIPICFGIDATGTAGVGKESNRLRSYGFAWTRRDGWQGPWRQRSQRRADENDVPEELTQELRIMQVRGGKVAVLVCGEIFNGRIRYYVDRSSASGVVNMVHKSQGFRFHSAGSKWSERERACLMSSHAKRITSKTKNRWATNGHYGSSEEADILIDSPVRIKGKLADTKG